MLNKIGKWIINFIIYVLLFAFGFRIVFVNHNLKEYPFLYFFLYQFVFAMALWYVLKKKENTPYYLYIIPTFITFVIFTIFIMLYIKSCAIELVIPNSYIIWIYIYNVLALGVIIYDFFKNRVNKLEYILFVPLSVIVLQFLEYLFAYTTSLGLSIHVSLFFYRFMGWA